MVRCVSGYTCGMLILFTWCTVTTFLLLRPHSVVLDGVLHSGHDDKHNEKPPHWLSSPRNRPLQPGGFDIPGGLRGPPLIRSPPLEPSDHEVDSYLEGLPGGSTTAGSNEKAVEAVSASKRCTTAEGRKTTKIYRLGNRHDFTGSIKDGFDLFKLCQEDKKKFPHEKFDVFWGLQFDDSKEYKGISVKDGGLVSSIPGLRDYLGLKPSLASLHSACLAHFASLAPPTGNSTFSTVAHSMCSFTKRAFNIEVTNSLAKKGLHEVVVKVVLQGGIKSLLDHSKILQITDASQKEFPQLWIMKPQNKFNGDGIHIVEIQEDDVADLQSFKSYVARTVPKGSYTMQEYIRSPLTYKKRKFDLRIWAVITSMTPLTIYALDHAFPKVSTENYSPSAEFKKRTCMHFRMPLGKGCDPRNVLSPYPKDTHGENFVSGLEYYGEAFDKAHTHAEVEALHPHDKRPDWILDVWPQVGDLLALSIIATRQAILTTEADVIEKKSGDSLRRYNRFAFISPDMAIDSVGKVSMIELNTNGFMIGDAYPAFYTAQMDTLQAMQLLGIDDYPQSKNYESSKVEAVTEFCKQLSEEKPHIKKMEDATICSKNDIAMLYKFIDEEMHMGGKWQRVFPPQDDSGIDIDMIKQFWSRYAHFYKTGGKGFDHKENKQIPATFSRQDNILWKFITYRKRAVSVDKNSIFAKCCATCAKDGATSPLERPHARTFRPWWFENV